jgi:hypothetical protein
MRTLFVLKIVQAELPDASCKASKLQAMSKRIGYQAWTVHIVVVRSIEVIAQYIL